MGLNLISNLYYLQPYPKLSVSCKFHAHMHIYTQIFQLWLYTTYYVYKYKYRPDHMKFSSCLASLLD